MSESTTYDDVWLPVADGQPYLRFLKRMHQHLQPEWYLEVGTAQGASLRSVTCNAIAVDPKFQILQENLGKRPQTHLFEMTSDDFFASGAAARLAPAIDLAFLDGMHLFEYLLRDFINAEKLCHKESVVVLHDLVPPSLISAEREWDKSRTKVWTGDVWKLAVILKDYRPDLTLRVANCRPTGLGLVTGLNPDDTTLEQQYDEIVERFMDLSIIDFGPERLQEITNMQRANGDEFHRFTGTPV
jgi:hypothetical protein